MEGIYGINYDGVKKRPTFEELIDYKEPKITYPDRSALFTRESPLMTQFDNIGAMELEDQQRREMRERMKEDMLKRIASSTPYSLQELRAMNMRSSPQFFRMDSHTDTSSVFENAESELEEELRERVLQYRATQRRAIELIDAVLDDAHSSARASQLMDEGYESAEEGSDEEEESEEGSDEEEESEEESDEEESEEEGEEEAKPKRGRTAERVKAPKREQAPKRKRTPKRGRPLKLYSPSDFDTLKKMQKSKLLQLAERKGILVDDNKKNRSYRLPIDERTAIINDILEHDERELRYTD